jgi:hypothetical protein
MSVTKSDVSIAPPATPPARPPAAAAAAPGVPGCCCCCCCSAASAAAAAALDNRPCCCCCCLWWLRAEIGPPLLWLLLCPLRGLLLRLHASTQKTGHRHCNSLSAGSRCKGRLSYICLPVANPAQQTLHSQARWPFRLRTCFLYYHASARVRNAAIARMPLPPHSSLC